MRNYAIIQGMREEENCWGGEFPRWKFYSVWVDTWLNSLEGFEFENCLTSGRLDLLKRISFPYTTVFQSSKVNSHDAKRYFEQLSSLRFTSKACGLFKLSNICPINVDNLSFDKREQPEIWVCTTTVYAIGALHTREYSTSLRVDFQRMNTVNFIVWLSCVVSLSERGKLITSCSNAQYDRSQLP